MTSITDDQRRILRKLYYEDGLACGIVKLYKTIRDNYPDSNITRQQVTDWLSIQESWQIHQGQKQIKTYQTHRSYSETSASSDRSHRLLTEYST